MYLFVFWGRGQVLAWRLRRYSVSWPFQARGETLAPLLVCALLSGLPAGFGEPPAAPRWCDPCCTSSPVPRALSASPAQDWRGPQRACDLGQAARLLSLYSAWAWKMPSGQVGKALFLPSWSLQWDNRVLMENHPERQEGEAGVPAKHPEKSPRYSPSSYHPPYI